MSRHARPADAPRPTLRFTQASTLAALAAVALAAGCGSTPEFDVIVRHGTVVDGTGAPARPADVGIVGDRITEVGDLSSRRGRVEVDASNLVVAPGFIDTQGQSGRALLLDGAAESHLRQGITSEIIGEASSPAFWQADTGDVALLNNRGIPFDWGGLAGFLQKLETAGIALNLGSLVPANQVRSNVMRLAARAPTDAERQAMRLAVEQAMRDGAFGLSSALIYPPGSFMTTGDLVELARIAAAHGGIYVSHIRGETHRLLTALDEAVTIGREAGLPVVVYHLKVAERSRWGTMPDVLAKIEEARASGVDISATQYPYTVAGTSLDACLPDWVLEGGTGAALRRLADPDVRRRIRREVERGHDGWENFLRSAGFDGVTIASVPSGADDSVVGQNLAAIASARGADPWDVFFDLLVEHQLAVSALYALMHDDDVRAAMTRPWITIGTDSAAQTDAAGQPGKPHPRGFGTMPRVLGHYVREHGILSLPEAVHKMTSAAARQMRLVDRGELRPGAFADVVVFDPATIGDRATFDEPRQYPAGIRTVIVNGVIALDAGEPTGRRAGRGLRRAPVVPRPSPVAAVAAAPAS